MSLIDFQRLLLRLYTESSLLAEFFKTPDTVFARYDLTEREKCALAHIPRHALEEFHNQLVGKRKRIGKKILRRPDAIVLVSFSEEGPALMWGNPANPRRVYVSPGMYWLLHKMGLGQYKVSWKTLFSAYQTQRGQSSLYDLFGLAKLLSQHKLYNKTVVNI